MSGRFACELERSKGGLGALIFFDEELASVRLALLGQVLKWSDLSEEALRDN